MRGKFLLRAAIRQFVYKNIDSGIQPLPFQHGAPLNFGDKRASLVQNAHSTRLPFSPEMARSNRLFVLFTNLLAAYHAVRACPPPQSSTSWLYFVAVDYEPNRVYDWGFGAVSARRGRRHS